MVRFAVIGTNFITKSFLSAAALVEDFTLTAIYSRDLARAEAFAAEHNVSVLCFDSLEALIECDTIDAVYIASPNALHAPQALQCIQGDKHVLVEKAAASNLKELETVLAAAKAHGVVFMEAMKSLTMPAYVLLKKELPRIAPIRRYTGSYCQYSSRYDRYKAKEPVNTFDPAFANGSLMDIGIYGLYPLVDLFGLPLSMEASGMLLAPDGVDGTGTLLCRYRDMEAVVVHSKISNSSLPSEIQGEGGSILIDRIGSPHHLTLIHRDGTVEPLSVDTAKEDMVYELREFIQVIQSGHMESTVNSHSLTRKVHQLLTEARRQMGLVFPADR